MKETFENYYIVKTRGFSLTFTTIFNPETLDVIDERTWDIDDTYLDTNERALTISSLPRNEAVTKLYKHFNGEIQIGDEVKIIKGRKFKNEIKQIEKMFDYTIPNTYGKIVVKYLVFTDGTKVNIDNCELIKNYEKYKNEI